METHMQRHITYTPSIWKYTHLSLPVKSFLVSATSLQSLCISLHLSDQGYAKGQGFAAQEKAAVQTWILKPLTCIAYVLLV